MWEKVIVKFNVIMLYIGYFEKLLEIYIKKIIDFKLLFVENVINLDKILIVYGWSKWNKLVDRSEWYMFVYMVNVYYDL